MWKKYEKIYGTLIVKHVDTKGNELTNTIETTEIVGTDYVTNKIDLEGYEFIEVTGDPVEGKYIDGKLTVTYVYEFVDGKGGDDSCNIWHAMRSNEPQYWRTYRKQLNNETAAKKWALILNALQEYDKAV